MSKELKGERANQMDMYKKNIPSRENSRKIFRQVWLKSRNIMILQIKLRTADWVSLVAK